MSGKMKFKQLMPEEIESVSIVDSYKVPKAYIDKKFLRINMVSSIDGTISIDGRARALSSDADRNVFHILRSLADVILVGAGTMRSEEYKPVSLTEHEIERRKNTGQEPIPKIAVVTRSGEFNFDTAFFKEAINKPLIFTSDIGAKIIANKCDSAEVISCGKTVVDLRLAIDELVKRDYKNILCEGGPTLNSDLLRSRLVDELCLTVSPKITQGDGNRIFNGPKLDIPVEFEYQAIFIDEGELFFRLKNNSALI